MEEDIGAVVLEHLGNELDVHVLDVNVLFVSILLCSDDSGLQLIS